jgi:hypothetical protein
MEKIFYPVPCVARELEDEVDLDWKVYYRKVRVP